MEHMEKERHMVVPYIVYRDAASQDRWIIRRLTTGLIIALVVAVLALFISNMAWLWYFNQYDYVTDGDITTVDSEGDGIANYTGGNGGVVYGEGDREADY